MSAIRLEKTAPNSRVPGSFHPNRLLTVLVRAFVWGILASSLSGLWGGRLAAQNRVIETYEQRTEQGLPFWRYSYYRLNGVMVKHGLESSWTADGALLKRETEWADGNRHGADTTYDAQGRPAERIEYQNGVKEGTATNWFPDGRVSTIYTYANGLLHGPYEEWRIRGNDGLYWLFGKGQYERDKYSGLCLWWYSPGNAPDEYLWEAKKGLIQTIQYTFSSTTQTSATLSWDYRVSQGVLQEDGQWFYIGETFLRSGLKTSQTSSLSADRLGLGGTKKVGTHSYWLTNGAPRLIEAEYLNGKVHGTRTQWRINGQIEFIEQYVFGDLRKKYSTDTGAGWEETHYFLGKRHGLSTRADFATGRITEQGNYSDGKQCGAWRTWNNAKKTYDTADRGPCGPASTGSPLYKDLSDTTNGVRVELRGTVSESDSGSPIDGATVAVSGSASARTTTDIQGNYSVVLDRPSSVDVVVSKAGFFDRRGSFDLKGVQHRVANARMKKKGAIGKPVITGVRSSRGTVFLSGLPLPNDYQVEVDWNGGEPGRIDFEVNGQISSVPATASGASRGFDMGSQFRPSVAAKGNVLRITAVNRVGDSSGPEVLNPIVLPVPDWSEDFGVFRALPGEKTTKYSLDFAFPKPGFRIQINPETLGPTLWQAWGFFPLIGGQNLGIPETQILLSAEAKTDGTGGVAMGGQSGFEVGGQTFSGKLQGKGHLGFTPGTGLEWKGGSVLFGVEGTLTKEVGPVTLIPALQGAVNMKVIGGLISWFNDTVKIKGIVKGGCDTDFFLRYDSARGISFQRNTGELKTGIELGLAGEISKVKAFIGGGGLATMTWQVPPEPDYIKKIEAQFAAKLDIEAWLFKGSFEGSHTFTYPGGGPSVASLSRDLKPITPLFLESGPAQLFMPGRVALQSQSATSSITNQMLMQNVYPLCEPALVERNGRALLALVQFDPADPVLRATDISFSSFNNGSWTAPRTIRNDTQAEFAPTLAILDDGRAVAVWERVKNTAFPTNGTIDQMVAELEIVWAVLNPVTGVWTGPTPLTDNGYLDHSPVLRQAADGALFLFWLDNRANELVGTASSPSRLQSARWDGKTSTFTTPVEIGAGFAHAYQFTFAAGRTNEAVVGYVVDGDGKLSTREDAEIYTLLFDGQSWSPPSRITQDAVADSRPQVGYTSGGIRELVWLRGETLVRLTDWRTANRETIRTNCNAMSFSTFQLLPDASGRLLVIWPEPTVSGVELFVNVFDPVLKLWSQDIALGVSAKSIRSFFPAFASNGVLKVIHTRTEGNPEKENLYLKTTTLGVDLVAVPNSLSVTPARPVPGNSVTLACQIRNAGTLPVKSPSVSFYVGDPSASGQLIKTVTPSLDPLPGGATALATCDWLIPVGLTNYDVVVQVDALNAILELSETNNRLASRIIKPDLAAQHVEVESPGDGSTLAVVSIRNQGLVTARDIKVALRVDGLETQSLTIPGLAAGAVADAAFQVWRNVELGGDASELSLVVDPGDTIEESDETNNELAFAAGISNDLDNDGLPDAWETRVVQSRTGDALINIQQIRPQDDLDGDGVSNEIECQNGTDPLVREVGFSLSPPRWSSSGQAIISWSGQVGARYQLDTSTDLRVWTSQGSPITATGTSVEVTLKVLPDAQFFRVRLIE